jgi:hypothetical protein
MLNEYCFSFADALRRLQVTTYFKLRDGVLGLTNCPTELTPKLTLETTLKRIRVIEKLIASPAKKLSGSEPAMEYLVERDQLVPQADATVADSPLKMAAMERLVVSPFVRVRKQQMQLLLAGPIRVPGSWWPPQSEDDGKGSWKVELERLEVETEWLLADES